MGDEDVSARREAVARLLAGEPAAKVAAELGRTERWVRKWVRRYDPANDGWAAGQSRAPHRQARRTPVGTERLILTLKEQCIWTKTYTDVAELRAAVADFVQRYNRQWLIERHGHRTPREVYQSWLQTGERVA